jgi:hypothetical protein
MMSSVSITSAAESCLLCSADPSGAALPFVVIFPARSAMFYCPVMPSIAYPVLARHIIRSFTSTFPTTSDKRSDRLTSISETLAKEYLAPESLYSASRPAYLDICDVFYWRSTSTFVLLRRFQGTSLTFRFRVHLALSSLHQETSSFLPYENVATRPEVNLCTRHTIMTRLENLPAKRANLNMAMS